MNLETIIQEKVHALPTVKQEKVLAFVEELEHEEIKSNGKPERTAEERRQGRRALIGMFKSGHSDTSERVDQILAEGINKREGWSLP
jgi:hypothetical protein